MVLGKLCLPHLDHYNYLGVKFTYNGHWDAHIKDFVTASKRKVNSLLRILNSPHLSLYAKRQVILYILRPSLEYSSEVWRCTTVLLAACKKILFCSSKTCTEAVWGDLGIEPLNLRRNKRKVVWFSRLLKKSKDSFCQKVKKKKNGINVKFQVERESSGRIVFRYYK